MLYDYTGDWMSCVNDVVIVDLVYNLKQRLWEIKDLHWMCEINTSDSTIANSFSDVVSSEKSY